MSDISTDGSKIINKQIVFNKTPCCSNYPQWNNNNELDADCVTPGDMLMCPIHKDIAIYVFGTNWWQGEGGTFEKNPTLKCWCGKCLKIYEVNCWSYRG